MRHIFGEIQKIYFSSPSIKEPAATTSQAEQPLLIEQLFTLTASIDRGISGSEFCRSYLGVDRNYLSVCRHRRTDLSARLVLRLYRNLRKRSDIWASIESVDQRVRRRCKDRAQSYRRVADMALQALCQNGRN
jgi:plasmid maintenance system antidote protein VapI